jgi:hypothetical protein
MNARRHRRPAASIVLASAMALAAAAAPSAVEAASPFTLIVVPDTQNYTDFADINTQYNLGQMRWIRDNMTNLNIRFVMHLGDHQNPGNPYRARTDNIYEPDLARPIGNVSDKETVWARADAAIQVLDNNNIPYSLVPGNHDYLDHDTKAEPWLYLKTFGPQRYADEQSTWAPSQRTYAGASPVNPNNGYAGMNTYHRFDVGGYSFVNIALKVNPDNNDFTWAQQVINENPGLPTIITTHAFVNTKPAASDYQHADIFDKLVKNNPQIVMTFNGHLTGSNYVAGMNIAGQTVHQMLVDFQASQLDAQLGADYYRGGGVLRQMLFDPDNDRVNIKDYSVVAQKFLPNNFTAPDNDSDTATYSTPTGFDLDLDGRFGLPNHGGITSSKSFQQGAAGYTGTRDTYVSAAAPTTNYGNETIAWIDGDRDDATAGQQPSHGLIRFDFIVGPGGIPDGAVIDSATLVLHTSALADSQSPNTIRLHRLLKGWTEPNATWDSQGDGIADDAVDAILAANDTAVPSVAGGFVSFDVTESLYAWLAGAPNNGWALLPGGNNGWRWDTSEAADIANRPTLNVTYRVVPEPAGALGFTIVTLVVARRRRRKT